jgi:hypothetical protein
MHTYELEINRTSDFTNPQTHLLNLTDTVYRTQYPAVDTLFWRVRVQDAGTAASWSDVFEFTTRKNIKPVFISVADTIATEGSLYFYHAYARDADSLLFGDIVKYRKIKGPGWLQIDSLTGVLSGIPQDQDAGDTTVTVYAIDLKHEYAEQSWKLSVEPVFFPPGPVTLLEPAKGNEIPLFRISSEKKFVWSKAIDPDAADTLRYRLRIKSSYLDTVVVVIEDTFAVFTDNDFLEKETYTWSVSAFDSRFETFASDSFTFITTRKMANTTFTDNPGMYFLFQNYPNPFNPNTTLRFQLPEKSKVKIEVYNILGQSVDVLFNGTLNAKYYEMEWVPRSLASGIYFARITAEGTVSSKKFRSVKKMTYLK